MNDNDVSWVPTKHKTLTWYARFKYISFYVLVMFRHVDWLALYSTDNISVLGKFIATSPVRVLAEAEYRQSSMESDNDKAKKIQKKNSTLNQ
jgi:hypothetical protein